MTKTEKRKVRIDLLAILLGGLLPERICQKFFLAGGGGGGEGGGGFLRWHLTEKQRGYLHNGRLRETVAFEKCLQGES